MEIHPCYHHHKKIYINGINPFSVVLATTSTFTFVYACILKQQDQLTLLPPLTNVQPPAVASRERLSSYDTGMTSLQS
jgi:hypothetical protein